MALGPKPHPNGKQPRGAELKAQAEAERTKGMHASEELAEQVKTLEAEMEELKAKYELYFLGVERLEPARWRDDVKKQVLRMISVFTRNTGLRFRIQTLYARFQSYERLWMRAAKQREDGTYRRDLFKA